MKRLKPTIIFRICFINSISRPLSISYDLDGGFSNEARSRCYKNLTSWKAFLPSFNPADWFKPYQEVLARFSILTYLGNSIFYAGTFALGSIIVNALAGFAFAKINFTGKKFCLAFYWPC